MDARIRADPERLPADGGNGHQIVEGVVADADQGFGPRQQRGIEGLQARDHTVGLICTAADLAERSGKAELPQEFPHGLFVGIAQQDDTAALLQTHDGLIKPAVTVHPGLLHLQAGQAIDLICAVAVQTAERVAQVGQNGPRIAEIDHIVCLQRFGIGHIWKHPLPECLHKLRHGGDLCMSAAVETVHVQLPPGEDGLCQPDKVRLQRLGPRPGNKRPQIAAVKDAVLINGSVEIEDDDPVLHGGPPFVRRLAGSCG